MKKGRQETMAILLLALYVGLRGWGATPFQVSVKSGLDPDGKVRIAATGTASIPATAVYLGRPVAGADYFAGDLDFLHIAASLLRPQVRPIHRWIVGAHGFGANEDWVVMAD